jgi:hypothetical protein
MTVTNDPSAPTDAPWLGTNTSIVSTNYTYIIPPYTPSQYAGPVTLGELELDPTTALPSGISLYADYIPRHIRQFRFHYRLNWPGTNQPATQPGDLLSGWSATYTPDGTNGTWLYLSSPLPQYDTNSLPYATFGTLLNFTFRDQAATNFPFAFFTLDTNVYWTNSIAGGPGCPTFSNNLNGFTTNYPVLPHGTPVPWLVSYGFKNNWTNAETADPDHDGMPTWMEYQAGTNPTNAASVFAIQGVVQSMYDGRYEITFSTSLWRFYTVEGSTDLVNWQTVQGPIPGTGGAITVIDTTFVPAPRYVFYRVLVQ